MAGSEIAVVTVLWSRRSRRFPRFHDSVDARWMHDRCVARRVPGPIRAACRRRNLARRPQSKSQSTTTGSGCWCVDVVRARRAPVDVGAAPSWGTCRNAGCTDCENGDRSGGRTARASDAVGWTRNAATKIQSSVGPNGDAAPARADVAQDSVSGTQFGALDTGHPNGIWVEAVVYHGNCPCRTRTQQHDLLGLRGEII